MSNLHLQLVSLQAISLIEVLIEAVLLIEAVDTFAKGGMQCPLFEHKQYCTFFPKNVLKSYK